MIELIVVQTDCQKYAHYAWVFYAECRYVKCRAGQITIPVAGDLEQGTLNKGKAQYS